MMCPYRLPKNYKIPEDVVPKVKIKDPQIIGPGDFDPVALRIARKASEEIQQNLVRCIAEACVEVNVDPDILQKQSAELKRQAGIIKTFQDALSGGSLRFQPAELGREVWVLDKGTIYRGTVYRYEQSLSPYHKNNLSYVDLHIGQFDSLVRRYCYEFGKTIFFTQEEAREARNASKEAQTDAK